MSSRGGAVPQPKPGECGGRPAAPSPMPSASGSPPARRGRAPQAACQRRVAVAAAARLVVAVLTASALAWASEEHRPAWARCGGPGRAALAASAAQPLLPLQRRPRGRAEPPRTARRVDELRGPTGKLIKCPGCGKAQRADCDGTGKLTGGLGNLIKDFKLITAHAPCPRYTANYGRRGKTLNDLFDPTGTIRDDDQKLTVPAVWRSLTKIRLREVADVKAQATGDAVKPFEKFKVVDVVRRGDQHFLKLESKNGWVFDRGVAGNWAGRPIAERLPDDA